jgi:hypothetical protein
MIDYSTMMVLFLPGETGEAALSFRRRTTKVASPAPHR